MAKKVQRKIETRPLQELTKDFFVRAGMNTDRVIELAMLLEEGVDLGPILITKDGRVVDGRHRMDAHELLERPEIECEVTSETRLAVLIGMAYCSNSGGALPPSRKDTEHTVMMLLDQRVTIREISDLLAIPPSLSRRYVASVKAKMRQLTLQKAADAVTREEDSLTVPAAAHEHGIEPKVLRDFMGKTSRKGREVGDYKRRLTAHFKSTSARLGQMLKTVREQFEDGELNKRQVDEVLAAARKGVRQAQRRVDDWDKRIAQLITGRNH